MTAGHGPPAGGSERWIVASDPEKAVAQIKRIWTPASTTSCSRHEPRPGTLLAEFSEDLLPELRALR